MESVAINQEEINKLVKKRQLDDRKNYALEMLTRGTKYIQGYLYDYNVSIRRDYKGYKLRAVIEIDCVPEDLEEEVSGVKKKPETPTVATDVSKEEIETEKEILK
jgi:hypothetical protein